MCNPWSSSMWVKDWNSIVDTAELAPNDPLSDEDLDWMGKLGEWPDRKQTGVNFVEIANTIEEIYLRERKNSTIKNYWCFPKKAECIKSSDKKGSRSSAFAI